MFIILQNNFMIDLNDLMQEITEHIYNNYDDFFNIKEISEIINSKNKLYIDMNVSVDNNKYNKSQCLSMLFCLFYCVNCV